jgi:hypothetical protein
MSLFFRKEREVMRLISEYFDAADEAIRVFESTMECYLQKGICQDFSDGDQRLHSLESRADDLIRAIEKRLYSHSLLPESRGDLLGLLEHFDSIPNLAETVTFIFETQRVEIPERLERLFYELVAVNVEACRLVRQAVQRLFEDPDTVGEAVQPVDEKESESDRIEREIIVEVFQSDMPGLNKILLREVTQRIGDLSDAAENVAGRLEVISLKRRI